MLVRIDTCVFIFILLFVLLKIAFMTTVVLRETGNDGVGAVIEASGASSVVNACTTYVRLENISFISSN